MSSAILTLLVSHILTFLENEFIKEEPNLIAILTHDIQSLISKLERFISVKSPTANAIATPVLNVVSTLTTDALEAAGSAVVQGISTPQSAE